MILNNRELWDEWSVEMKDIMYRVTESRRMLHYNLKRLSNSSHFLDYIIE